MSEIAKHWIDGQWVGSDTISESVNPATGAVLGRWADGGEAEARAAIAAAPRAFDPSPWSPGPRRPRRRAWHAGDQGERQEDRRRPVRGDIPQPHASAQRGAGPDRHRHLGRG